ncbi:sigma-54 interaction domain-containing protein [Marinobacter fonticola]|uniref:sigma-54 interaction domain-containing protein n=1 Tax=Marinobacter fonticola TaxID=2603215 RepID=UPI0011E7A9ED|nr:sigma-54 dependent transcriptional regulator [Marinobacter fonticola]
MSVIKESKLSSLSAGTPGNECPVSANHVLVLAHSGEAIHLSEIPDTQNCTATFTQNAGYALQVLRELRPGIAILSVGRGTASELSIIEEAAKLGARVVVTGPDERGLFAQQSRARGALIYLQNPVDTADIWSALSELGQTSDRMINRSGACASPASTGEDTVWDLLHSESDTMQRIAEQIRKVAPTTATVMLTGESGTGKEVVARAIHDHSDRRDKPFLPVNCGAMSPQLIESELFGHDKGSFTGAVKDHQGVFERAHGGTLFLDEITEMPIELQVKLLRVLESREFVRVGSHRVRETDVRVICASNRKLEREVEAGNLRSDLLYRIQVFPIVLPPLRARGDDISLLANCFLDELNAETGRRTQLSRDALNALKNYPWPGNLRELKNVMQRAHIMADEWIRADDLPDAICHPLTADAGGGPSLTVNIGTSVAEMEKNLILATLERVHGRKDRAAHLLGVSLKTLYNRLRDYERDGS